MKQQEREQAETHYAVTASSRDLLSELRLRHIEDHDTLSNRVQLISAKVEGMADGMQLLQASLAGIAAKLDGVTRTPGGSSRGSPSVEYNV